jgi:competence protein ComGB
MTDGCTKMSKNWSKKEQALFLQKSGELLSRGYSLSEAIESLVHYLPKAKQETLHQCIIQLREGYPLHQILTNLRFSKDLVGYVFFAEEHGSLAVAFKDGSAIMLKRDQDIERIAKLFYYPMMLIIITTILFFFVERFLLPKFTSLFHSLDLQANIFTKIVYAVGDFFPKFLVFLLLLLFLLCCYYLFWFRKQSPLTKRKTIVTIPFIGSFFQLWFTHYFSIQMSYLLSGGLSIYEALHLFERNREQPFYGEIGQLIREKLTKGERLETIVKTIAVFENDLTTIMKHGQETGKLADELAFYSKHCLDKMEEKTEKCLKIFQPAIYLFIGLLIVSMYLAILLPMFHMLNGL